VSNPVNLDRALGWSLALKPFDPIDGAAGGLDLDFSAVSGADALMQSLTLAFVTLKGSDVFNSGFGFSGLVAIAEESDPIIRRERVRMAAIAVLQAEPRIRRVITVRFADEAHDISTPVYQDRPPSRTVQIEAVFETIAGTRQTIALGGEALDVQ
jgi:phage baseplate assembly protein W